MMSQADRRGAVNRKADATSEAIIARVELRGGEGRTGEVGRQKGGGNGGYVLDQEAKGLGAKAVTGRLSEAPWNGGQEPVARKRGSGKRTQTRTCELSH